MLSINTFSGLGPRRLEGGPHAPSGVAHRRLARLPRPPSGRPEPFDGELHRANVSGPPATVAGPSGPSVLHAGQAQFVTNGVRERADGDRILAPDVEHGDRFVGGPGAGFDCGDDVLDVDVGLRGARLGSEDLELLRVAGQLADEIR